MSKPSTVARSALAAAAGVMALGAAAAPQLARAQAYGPPPAYSDACRSARSDHTALGVVLGAGAGAVLGSQVAANHHRTDGSIVGGLLGALGGGLVAHNSRPCPPDPAEAAPPPPPAGPPPLAYASPPPPPADYGRGDGPWAYGPRGERLRIADRPVGPDGCTLAESPIYMPDGRVQQRFVRVCMDPSGRYQVVD